MAGSHRRTYQPRSTRAAAPIDLSALTSLVGFAVRIAQLHVYDHFHRELWRRHHVHPGAYSALMVIQGNPGIRPGELAAALVVKRPNMTKLLDSLERRGWIARQTPQHDGRGVSLVLTPAGLRKVERFASDAALMDREATDGLSKRERTTLLGLLDKLSAGVKRAKGRK
jgi:DNA-binding MarR family transcriptional regulator